MRLLKRLFGAGQASPSQSVAQDDPVGAWVRDGYDAHARGEHERAQELFQRALEQHPSQPDALYFLGALAAEDKREVEAIDYLERAVAARPADATFRYALGTALHNGGRFAEASRHFLVLTRLQPDHRDALGLLWMAMLESGREQEVREAAEKARAEGQDNEYIDINLAAIYRNHGRIEESIAASRRLLARLPDNAGNYSDLLMSLNYSDRHTAQSIYAEHRAYAARFARPYLGPKLDAGWPRRLRIGYVSPDFRAHVVALFFEPILERRDRLRFEVFCYYNNCKEDEYTERLRRSADHWRDCMHLSDAELAERIRADRIDILVDLTGHTAYNRLGVFAMKPAPVQATYLGYPNTTGLSAMDYRLTDARADPPGEADRLSSEKLMRLPRCFHTFRPAPHAPEVSPLPAASRGYVTFGCFNNVTKLSDSFLDAAARVLAALPGSRLQLKGKPFDVPDVVRRVRGRFAGAGIDARRLDLLGWKASLTDHLQVYANVDIALDSFPYNGTTTTCEALWMGVPVVTVAGDRHAARVGASLLGAVGLEHLVARDIEGFVARCTELASDVEGLAALRASLRARVQASPIRDEEGFTRDIEAAFVAMWEARLARDEAASACDAHQVELLMTEAAALRAAGRAAEAGELYEQVLSAKPDHDEALAGIWDLSFETGSAGAAIDWLNKGIAARPEAPRFHYMLGCSFHAKGSLEDAVESFTRAIELDPRYGKAHNNLGCALEAAGALGRALECYERSVELEPRLAVAWYNAGNALRQLGAGGRAIAAIRQALAIDPAQPDWHSNLGDLFYGSLRLDEAVTSYHRALHLSPGHARARHGLGLTLLALGRGKEAEEALERAVAVDPGAAATLSSRLLAMNSSGAEDRARVFAAHREWDARHAKVAWQSARTQAERRARRRLRIGYVSPDFREHPVASFIEPLLAAHDRTRHRVFGYFNSLREDAATRRIAAHCDHWRVVAGQSDEQLAERIRFDGIDILVDLAGHTGGGRLKTFALKPAPVQVSWLGYPNTTGLRAIDYRFTDAIADPEGESERFHSEALVRLPKGFLCYQPPADAPAVVAPPGAARGHVTFGSFNNLSKVTDFMLQQWVRILAEVPGSRLALKAYGLAAASARQRLQERFAALGIGADRLELLAPEETGAAHLARYGAIDVALDTFPYNGTTTTCEALWMGVPVVTLAGEAHPSRVGLSLLSRVGLHDLAARSGDEYVAIAARLARDEARRRDLRSTLRARLAPLADAIGFAQTVEAAYEEMWRMYSENVLRLHIGGKQQLPGWKILNIQDGPGVDYVGDCTDLAQFEEGSVEEIYASHVLEHLGYREPLQKALAEFHRVLKPGGRARISVPDFETVCRLFLDPSRDFRERINLMQIAFGGQTDRHDFHHAGLYFELLAGFLREAGFSRVERVEDLGLLDDDSRTRVGDVHISLNVVAWK